jgi:hypothetical protein
VSAQQREFCLSPSCRKKLQRRRGIHMKMQQKVENVWAREARTAADTSQTMLKKCVGRTRPFFPVVKNCSAAYKS